MVVGEIEVSVSTVLFVSSSLKDQALNEQVNYSRSISNHPRRVPSLENRAFFGLITVC